MADSSKRQIPRVFINVLRDFLNDLVRVFPDETNTQTRMIREEIQVWEKQQGIQDKNGETTEQTTEQTTQEETENKMIDAYELPITYMWFMFVQDNYSSHFFNILNKNDEMFEKECILLPNINFSQLWNLDITDRTKEVMWRYIQLLLFSAGGDQEHTSEDLEKIFSEINNEDFQKQMTETFKRLEETMADLSGQNGVDLSGEGMAGLDDLNDKFQGLFSGNLGEIAREIAEETTGELNIGEVNNIGDVFKTLFSNPTKIFGLFGKLQNKLKTKMKEKNITESDLMTETGDMMKQMQSLTENMPELKKMMSKMGLPTGNLNPASMAHMQNMMNQQMAQNSTRDRLRQKLQQRKQGKRK